MSQSPSAEKFEKVDKRLFPNPFGRIVGYPLEDGEIDIAEINRKAFAACQLLVRDVLNQRASACLTLFGDAGAGKTHVLGRVRKYLESMPDGCLFVFARMDTNARMLWRHLRRCLADALLRPSANGRRAIDDLLGTREAELALLPERDLGIVLENLLKGTHLRDAAAWLRGQELPEAALQTLKVAQPGPDDNQETASRDAILSLCSLLEPGAVVFCLDQMEALQSFSGDTDGLHAAGLAVSLLHDKARNICIICCEQTGFMLKLETLLDGPTRDRMLGRRQAIQPLDWEQARSLIAARLNSLPPLAELRGGHQSPLWPLSEQAIRPVFVDNAAPARKVISRCKDLFDQWRTNEAPSEETLDATLQKMLEDRLTEKDPGEAEAAFRDGLPLLLRSVGSSVALAGSRSPFDFLVNHGQKVIALCNQTHGGSLASRLKKINAAWNPAIHQNLVLLRDARLLMSQSAKVTRQQLQAIEEKGGRLVAVSQEAVECLAALRRLLADAESGDLAHHGDSIPPATVEQWIAGHLPAALDSLAAQLQAETPDRLSAKLAGLLAERKIVSLEDAARVLQAQPEEVESCARRDPRLFGILGGASPALFQPVRTEP